MVHYFIALTLSWRRFLSCRNQSIDLLWKSVDWFVYDGDLSRNRVNPVDTDVVTTLLQRRYPTSPYSCNGNVRQRCKNDVVATFHKETSLWDVATTSCFCNVIWRFQRNYMITSEQRRDGVVTLFCLVESKYR